MRNRRHRHIDAIGFVFDDDDEARAAFGAFLKTAPMLISPEIGIVNDQAGKQPRKGHALPREFVVEMGVFRRHAGG